MSLPSGDSEVRSVLRGLRLTELAKRAAISAHDSDASVLSKLLCPDTFRRGYRPQLVVVEAGGGVEDEGGNASTPVHRSLLSGKDLCTGVEARVFLERNTADAVNELLRRAREAEGRGGGEEGGEEKAGEDIGLERGREGSREASQDASGAGVAGGAPIAEGRGVCCLLFAVGEEAEQHAHDAGEQEFSSRDVGSGGLAPLGFCLYADAEEWLGVV